jgi:HlyD family secretion protein
MSKTLFRENALKKITSQENLEDALAVIRPSTKYWIISVSILVSFSIIWSFTGSIPVTVEGAGIITSKEGVKLVKIPFDGIVNLMHVEVGDTVEQGDLLLTIDQFQLKFEIKKLEKIVDDLTLKYNRLNEYLNESTRRVTIKELTKEKAVLMSSLMEFQTRLKESSSSNDNSLIESNILALEQQIDRINWIMLEAINFDRNELVSLHDEIVKTQNGLNQINSEYQTKTNLRSPYSGVIVEITLTDGDVFSASHPVVTIQNLNSSREDLSVILFVDAMYSNKVHEGMDVLVELSTVPKEEFGYLKGKVVEVGRYPSSREGLFKILRNDALITRLTETTLPVYIKVSLIKKKSNYSGFEWTSVHGPKMNIVSGTLVNAKIILDEKRPIEIIIPALNH